MRRLLADWCARYRRHFRILCNYIAFSSEGAGRVDAVRAAFTLATRRLAWRAICSSTTRMSTAPQPLALILDEPYTALLMKATLIQNGVQRAVVADHTVQIRRTLMLGANQLVVVCIALTEPTISRFGRAIQRLRADRNGFLTPLRLVGVLDGAGVTTRAAELGCDVYVENLSHAANVIHLLAEMCGARRAKLRLANPPGHGADDRRHELAWMRCLAHGETRGARLQHHGLRPGGLNGTRRSARMILRRQRSASGRDQGV